MKHHGLHMRAALSVKGLRKEMARAEGVNAKIAVAVTGWVSTMWCAYAFALLALLSLPAIMTQAFHWHFFPHWLVSVSLISLVAWISSYFLQLVLLSILSVQQSVEGIKNGISQAHVSSQIDVAVDRLDIHTQGGISTILERLDLIESSLESKLEGTSPPADMTKITARDILEAKRKLPPSSPQQWHT